MGVRQAIGNTEATVPTLEQTSLRPGPSETVALPDTVRGATRVAFLLSQYPAISHTFLLKEVLGLRARGMRVDTVSINPPDRPLGALSGEEALEARSTHYIQDGKLLRAAFTILITAVLNPAVTLRGLLAILRLNNLSLRKRAFWLFYLAEALLVGRWMRTRGLRHLHVHFGGPVASVGLLTSRAWKVPYSLTIHGPEELLDTTAYSLREKVEAASFVFCISDFCRSQLCQLTQPGEWPKFSVIRLGVDPAALLPSLPADGAGRPPLRLVCTGRLVAAKGHRVLLEALATLRERGVHFRTILIGSGPERENLEAFAARRGLGDSVLFTSALSHAETLRHVRSADIFVLASFAEGIPVALMEAMAFSVPCVSTYIAGIPELIHPGHDGLLVAPSNADALADALESLANDPSLRNFLGKSARRRIIRDYNLPLNQERLAQQFQQRIRALPEAGKP